MLSPMAFEYLSELLRQDIEDLEEKVSCGEAEQEELDTALEVLKEVS